jgi:hypothetical protein
VHAYLPRHRNGAVPVHGIVAFFLAVRVLGPSLSDGAGPPAFNLRSLTRALQYVAQATSSHGLPLALHDGFSMCFETMLDAESAAKVRALIQEHVMDGRKLRRAAAASEPPAAVLREAGRFVNVEGFWLQCGPNALPDEGGPDISHFILTPSVRCHLRAVARALFLRRFPVLLQGPTSSGKTSLVEYVAKMTGHSCVRINNHEHTDLQEYLGCYVSDESGRLVFQEGALVRAVRSGGWVLLDELNLAPTEVLEALNRLLDDNRELFVPELQEVVKPHPHFMLFGTQNPPGTYAGACHNKCTSIPQQCPKNVVLVVVHSRRVRSDRRTKHTALRTVLAQTAIAQLRLLAYWRRSYRQGLQTGRDNDVLLHHLHGSPGCTLCHVDSCAIAVCANTVRSAVCLILRRSEFQAQVFREPILPASQLDSDLGCSGYKPNTSNSRPGSTAFFVAPTLFCGYLKPNQEFQKAEKVMCDVNGRRDLAMSRLHGENAPKALL